MKPSCDPRSRGTKPKPWRMDREAQGMVRALLAAWLLVPAAEVVRGAAARAQAPESAVAGTAQGGARASSSATREEVAMALLRFERALEQALARAAQEEIEQAGQEGGGAGRKEPGAPGVQGGGGERPSRVESLMREADRRFDELSLLFFAGRLDRVRGALEGLTADLLGLEDEARDRFMARSRLQALVQPPFVVDGSESEIRVSMLGPDRRRLPRRARLVRGDESVAFELDDRGTATVRLRGGPGAAAPGEVAKASSLGRWTLLEDGSDEPLAFVEALPMPPGLLCEALEFRVRSLAAREGDAAIHPQSLAAVRSRAELLASMLESLAEAGAANGAPAPEGADDAAPWSQRGARRGRRLAERLLDTTRLADAVLAELEALESGNDPCATLDRGAAVVDRWQEIDAAGARLPVRVFAPSTVLGGRAPLVIALHGAGGDENMFMEAYGRGVIRRLAAEHGTVVVSPRVTPMAPWPVLFDAIVDEMERCHGIDRTRVVLVGHSMGAGVVASLVNARPEAIAAAAMIAGSGSITIDATRAPRLRVDAGGRDPVVPAARIARQVAAMRERGLSIEHREHAARGHTLIVGEVLPELFAWLLVSPQTPPAQEPGAPEGDDGDGEARRQHAPDIPVP